MKTPAFINTSDNGKDYVVKSVQTCLSQIYLNKLWLPDVLIDYIKDYLYISAEVILRKFHRRCINEKINSLTVDCHYLVDFYERRRKAHWSIGHVYSLPTENIVQIQQIMCVTCGEPSDYHTNLDGCCAMEWDGEDGTLELAVEASMPNEDGASYVPNYDNNHNEDELDQMEFEDYEMRFDDSDLDYDSDDYSSRIRRGKTL